MDETEKDNFTLMKENPIAVENEESDNEEDQKRRNEELQNMIANAFDDIGDDNSTINSSFDASRFDNNKTNKTEDYQHRSSDYQTSDYQNPNFKSDYSNYDEQYHETPFNSVEQLQVMYQVQVREIQNLNHQLTDLKQNTDKEKTALKKQLLLLEAEKNGLAISLQQSQNIVVEKNHNLEENNKIFDTLKESLEKQKIVQKNAEEETKIWKTRSAELEQKLNLIERGLYVPVSERQIRQKYEEQINNLQLSLEATKKQLESTQKNKITLENDMKHLKQTRDIAMLQKEDELHKIFTELESSKAQNSTLTNRIDQMEQEYQNLTQIFTSTQKELDATQSSAPLKTLQQELKRSLDEQKIKRDEIFRLEQNLNTQTQKISELESQIKNLEGQNLILNSQDNENTSKKSQIEQLENRIQQLLDSKIAYDAEKLSLLNEIGTQRKIMENTTKELEKYKQLARNSSDFKKLQNLENQRSNLEKQNIELQKVLSENEKLLSDLKEELQNYEKLCLELQSTCAGQKTNILENQTKISELESKLMLKNERDELLDDLQQKAKMFEDYIKTKSEIDFIDKSMNTELDTKEKETIQKLEIENKCLKERLELEEAAIKDFKKENQRIINLESMLRQKNTLVEELLNENIELKNRFKENVPQDILSLKAALSQLENILKIKNTELEQLKTENMVKEQNEDMFTEKYKQLETLLLQKETVVNQILNENKFLKENLKALSEIKTQDTNQPQEKDLILKLMTENKTLKQKIILDRQALKELTEIWTSEISRLNNLNKELETKNVDTENKQKEMNEEIAKMSVLISKLSESLRHKDHFIKEKEIKIKEYESIQEKLENEYKHKHILVQRQFEENKNKIKEDYKKKEEHLMTNCENIQKKFVENLSKIEEKLRNHLKYNNEKYTLETKIIEAYYDLLIQQAKIKKPK